jgi:hypothetical protein
MKNHVSGYNVIWNTPGQDSSGSMPLGNGDISVNAWVEQEGDLVFYIGKGNAWSEVHRLLKLGRLRVHFDPPILNNTDFCQTFDLETGSITIRAGGSEIRLWVDMGHPAIEIEIAAETPVGVTVSHEPWRTAEHQIIGNESPSAYGQHGSNPIVPTESADTHLPMEEGFMGWYHHNKHSIFRANLERQGMGELGATYHDPLLNRIFGCLVDGAGFVPSGKTAMTTAQPAREFSLRVVALTTQTSDAAAWVAQCRVVLESLRALPAEERFRAHGDWWKDFWSRSHVRISGGGEETESLSQAWHLYRFLCASQGRGEFPIKFNGGIFNVDIPGFFKDGSDANADYRNWGGAYWHQNTRQLYWPLLASGDADLMRPFFDIYRKNLAHAIERTKLWYDHEGAVFPETFYIWGALTDTNYGFDRADKPLSFAENNYIKRHWQGNLETLTMGLDFFDYFGDKDFLRESLLPLAEAVITFYDRHYPRAGGRLRMEPAQAMECLWDVVNPTPDIAGLARVLDTLLALPENLVVPEFRLRCNRLRGELPPLPVKQVGDQTLLANAEEVRGEFKNHEKAGLWAVFPYRQISVTGGDLDLGRATFLHGLVPTPLPEAGYFCWMNNNVFAAYLGLAVEARRHLATRVGYNRGNVLYSGRVADFRFPSMSGAGAVGGTGDWIPDLDNLGVVQQTLQAMLLQGDGKRLVLLPAWPQEWDVDFKLHAPGNTTVECVFRKGKVEYLRVTPECRAKDLEMPEFFQPKEPLV